MTLQFVLLKPLLAGMPFFFWLAGVAYEDHQYYDVGTGSIDWTSPKLYVLMVANISVSLAFYGLLSFYHTTEKGRNMYAVRCCAVCAVPVLSCAVRCRRAIIGSVGMICDVIPVCCWLSTIALSLQILHGVTRGPSSCASR